MILTDRGGVRLAAINLSLEVYDLFLRNLANILNIIHIVHITLY